MCHADCLDLRYRHENEFCCTARLKTFMSRTFLDQIHWPGGKLYFHSVIENNVDGLRPSRAQGHNMQRVHQAHV